MRGLTGRILSYISHIGLLVLSICILSMAPPVLSWVPVLTVMTMVRTSLALLVAVCLAWVISTYVPVLRWSLTKLEDKPGLRQLNAVIEGSVSVGTQWSRGVIMLMPLIYLPLVGLAQELLARPVFTDWWHIGLFMLLVPAGVILVGGSLWVGLAALFMEGWFLYSFLQDTKLESVSGRMFAWFEVGVVLLICTAWAYWRDSRSIRLEA